MIYPVVLAGGIGERLWPLSQELFPKQFIKLYNSRSTFQHVLSLNKFSPLIVSNVRYYDIIIAQLLEIGCDYSKLILEVEKVGTALSIALAASMLKGSDILLVLPSDCIIKGKGFYLDLVQKIVDYVRESRTLASIVVRSENGFSPYGYLKLSPLDETFYLIREFIEKPTSLLTNYDDYYWNTGMFICQVSTYFAHLRRYSPHLLLRCSQLLDDAYFRDEKVVCLRNKSDPMVDSLSVDRVLMEKCSSNTAVIADFDWCDMGNWDALYNNLQVDVVSVYRTNSCYDYVVIKEVINTSLVVVCFQDSIYLVRIGQVDLYNNCVIREWGVYCVLYHDGRIKIKYLVLDVGKSTSLQLHHHRNEDWLIISGLGHAIIGGNPRLLRDGDLLSVPRNCVHQIQNSSKTEKLILLEIQLGSILSEEDIVRL